MKIIVPAYQHQRSEEYLQTYDYWKLNYIYAIGNEDQICVDVKIEKVPTAFSHLNRWVDTNRIAIVTFENGLKKGDKVSVKFGGVDRPWLEGECKPSRVSQFSFKVPESYLEYKLFLDVEGDGNYDEVKAFPLIKILPDKAQKIVLTAPSIVRKNELFNINITVVDRFNNPIFNYNTDEIKLRLCNLKTKEYITIEKESNGFVTSIQNEGFYEITVIDESLNVEKAILICDVAMEKLYWGDIHTHSNLTANIRDNDCRVSPRQGYLYAREVAQLDYLCISEQTFMFNEDRSVNIDKETWTIMGEEADKYYEKGKFFTFAGVELHSKRGDTVIVFGDSLTSYPYPTENIIDIPDVWSYYKGKQFLTIPHLHRYCEGHPRKDQQEQKYTGFNVNNWKEDSINEVLCEIYSSQWGRFENRNHPMILKARANVQDNTVVDFLNKRKKWGITASSDGHDGKPGYGGLTGVYAKEKTRENIFQALSERKTIASAHPRIIIQCDINGYDIGDIITINGENRTINIKAIAPYNIHKLEIIKIGEIFIERLNVNNFIDETFLDDEKISKDTYYYIRFKLDNGHIGWTSPIWCTVD